MEKKDVMNMGNPAIHAKRGGIVISHDTWSPEGDVAAIKWLRGKADRDTINQIEFS